MLKGGNAVIDFLPSRSSMSSLGLTLINENFMQALLLAYSYESTHKFLDNTLNYVSLSVSAKTVEGFINSTINC